MRLDFLSLGLRNGGGTGGHRPAHSLRARPAQPGAAAPLEALQELRGAFPEQSLWGDRNLFFGDADSVPRKADGTLEGMCDPRRGGVYRLVSD